MNPEINEKVLLTIRDVLAAVAIVGILLASLWAYTGQFPNTPMVVVTSGSMMHADAPYGKIGTIDPGDLILVKKISSKDDVLTRGARDNPATHHRTYGDYGDVIIYHPMGNKKRTPIIHRAICWTKEIQVATPIEKIEEILSQDDIIPNIPDMKELKLKIQSRLL